METEDQEAPKHRNENCYRLCCEWCVIQVICLPLDAVFHCFHPNVSMKKTVFCFWGPLSSVSQLLVGSLANSSRYYVFFTRSDNLSPNAPDNPWWIFKDLQGQRISWENLQGIRTTPNFIDCKKSCEDEAAKAEFLITIISVVFWCCCSLACWGWRWRTVAVRCFGQLGFLSGTAEANFRSKNFWNSFPRIQTSINVPKIRRIFHDSFAGLH